MDNIIKSINKIKKLDIKQRELELYAKSIFETMPFGQSPPIYEKTLDKAIEIQVRKAKIWNDEIRNRFVPRTNKTFWQLAIQQGKLIVNFYGREEALQFYGEDIEKLIN